MTEKDQSVNNTEEEVNSEENVETQNVDNSQDSVENTDNSEVKERSFARRFSGRSSS